MFVCLLLCSVILMQESKSSGLGASFGGESRESLFGTGTAEVLKKFTGWLAFVFLFGCILLSLWTSVLGRATAQTSALAVEQMSAPEQD